MKGNFTMAAKRKVTARKAAGNSTEKRDEIGTYSAGNPMIGESPGDTIERVIAALKWLENADTVVERAAFAGKPNDAIQFGRFLLGQCCHDALRVARAELAATE